MSSCRATNAKESEAEARKTLTAIWERADFGDDFPTQALSAYRAAVLRSSEAETIALVERLRNRLWHDVGECGPTVAADAWLAARADKKEGGR